MKTPRRRLLALCGALIVLCSGTKVLATAETLDVSIGPLADPRYSVAPRIIQPAAQTFTISHAGKLSRVDLQMARLDAGVTEPLTMSIVRLTPAGGPDDIAPALATLTIPASSFPLLAFDPNEAYVSLPLDGSAPPVSAGDRLAVLLTTAQPYPFLGAPSYVWTTSQQKSVYNGGGFWYVNTLSGLWETDFSDAMTRVWVTVPEPGTATLSAILFVSVCRSRLRVSRGVSATRTQSPRRRGG